MFHRISGAPPETPPNVKYDAPREVCSDRKLFDRPLKKWGLEQVFHVNISWALTLCLLNTGRFHLLPLDVSAHILYSRLVMSNLSNYYYYFFFFVLRNLFLIVFKESKQWFFFYLFRNYIKEWFVMTPTMWPYTLYCSTVCEVASGLLTPRGRHNWTEI